MNHIPTATLIQDLVRQTMGLVPHDPETINELNRRIPHDTPELPGTTPTAACPFCGSVGVGVIVFEHPSHAFCKDCGAQGPKVPTKAAAAAAWNKRRKPG